MRMRAVIVALLVLAFAAPVSAAHAEPFAGPVRPAGANLEASNAVLNQINAERKKMGVAPLVVDRALVSAAYLHNRTMAAGCGLKHTCPGEPGLVDRVKRFNVPWSYLGENIGTGGPVTSTGITSMATQLNTMMINEVPPNDGHRRNILSPNFKRVGIQVYWDGSKVWLTQDFAG